MTLINRIISGVTGLLVLFVAGAAFWLSFDALRHLVESVGISESMSWLYPAIIDGAIVVFSLSILRANFNREKARYPWILVGTFTFLSVILNIIHAQQDLLARFLAAIPPIALFLSFELLMGQIRGIIERVDLFISLTAMQAEIDNKQIELEKLDTEGEKKTEKLSKQISQLEENRTQLKHEIKTLKVEKQTPKPSGTGNIERARKARASKKELAMTELISYLNRNPAASLMEMGKAIGRSKSTADGYIKELKKMGKIYKNGQGWIVRLSEGEAVNA